MPSALGHIDEEIARSQSHYASLHAQFREAEAATPSLTHAVTSQLKALTPDFCALQVQQRSERLKQHQLRQEYPPYAPSYHYGGSYPLSRLTNYTLPLLVHGGDDGFSTQIQLESATVQVPSSNVWRRWAPSPPALFNAHDSSLYGEVPARVSSTIGCVHRIWAMLEQQRHQQERYTKEKYELTREEQLNRQADGGREGVEDEKDEQTERPRPKAQERVEQQGVGEEERDPVLYCPGNGDEEIEAPHLVLVPPPPSPPAPPVSDFKPQDDEAHKNSMRELVAEKVQELLRERRKKMYFSVDY
jgi:hypothetical protein